MSSLSNKSNSHIWLQTSVPLATNVIQTDRCPSVPWSVALHASHRLLHCYRSLLSFLFVLCTKRSSFSATFISWFLLKFLLHCQRLMKSILPVERELRTKHRVPNVKISIVTEENAAYTQKLNFLSETSFTGGQWLVLSRWLNLNQRTTKNKQAGPALQTFSKSRSRSRPCINLPSCQVWM